MYNHLLTPIANMLITSEALLGGKYGRLTDEQMDTLTIIHDSAVRTYTFTSSVENANGQGIASETLDILTHDWLTPSASIISFCDYLLEAHLHDAPETRLQPEQLQKIRQIFYQAHYLRRQTYNLLDYSKIMRHDTRPMTEFDLTSILTPDLIFVDSDVPLHQDIPAHLPHVYSAKLYVVRTLSNLLANAFTFTRAGQVTLRAWRIGRFIEISVSDTGTGIPRKALKEIFRPFHQLGTHLPGIGLGLYIAKTFTELQGGTLEVESIVGKGSTFAITVPMA